MDSVTRTQPPPATLDRFDTVMTAVVVILMLTIAFVVLRGDQLGIGVQSFGPTDSASSRAVVRLTLDEALVTSSAAASLSISPAVPGTLTISQNQMSFQPAGAFQQGQEYTVKVRAGVQGIDGRKLKQDLTWKFRVAPPRVIYLGPVDNIVQNLFVADPVQDAAPSQLTTSANGIVGYDVSPDGGSVVYSELSGTGAASLMTLDLTTHKSSVLYQCPDATCTNPAWRPDGSAIAFEKVDLNTGTGMTPGVPRVWLLDVASGKVSQLFQDNQRLGYSPHWSPDGNLLAVFDTNAGGIVVHDFKAQTDQTIPTVQGEVGLFSPDGKWLYFPKVVDLGDGNYATHLVLVDVSSALYVQHDLVADSDPADDLEAVWSPDSKQLLVARRPPHDLGSSGTQLYSVEVATGIATPLVVDEAYSQSNIEISPAGDVMLFQRFPLDKPGAHIEDWPLNMSTHALKKVVDNGTSAHWLP